MEVSSSFFAWDYLPNYTVINLLCWFQYIYKSIRGAWGGVVVKELRY